MSDTDTHLLEETVDVLKENSKTSKDVLYVGILDDSREGYICKRWTWDQFVNHTKRIRYDRGFYSTICYVSLLLVVVGNDWWLSRRHDMHNGCEWWVFNTIPKVPDNVEPMEEDDLIDEDYVKSEGLDMNAEEYEVPPDF